MNAMRHTKKATTSVKKSGLRYSVTIEATFGSDHQHAVAMKVLRGLLPAWKRNVESHHQKNVITVTHQTLPSPPAS